MVITPDLSGFTSPPSVVSAPSGAPVKSGSGFLSGVLGSASAASSGLAAVANPLSSIMGALGGLAGGPDAALQPDQNTLDARQTSNVAFGSAFQVGGKGNSATSDASPTNSAGVAAAAPAGLSQNTLILLAVGLVGLLLVAFSSRK